MQIIALNNLPFLFFLGLTFSSLAMPSLSSQQIEELGMLIWKRESNRTVSGLISWNSNEPFPSLGIGHFIWFPEGKKYPFEEMLPKLLDYLESQKVILPGWLLIAKEKGCPWLTRESFFKDQNSPKMNDLKNLLITTIPLQAQFIVKRFSPVRSKLIAQSPPQVRNLITRRFDALARLPKGLSAMIDYVHCKGDGLNPKERYQNKGWGLLQVLSAMQDNASDILEEFIRSAKETLSQRVSLSDVTKNEARWLPGWHNRINSYR